MSWWQQLITIAHPDTHTRRRGRILAIVLLVSIALASAFIPLILLTPAPLIGFGLVGVCLAVFAIGLGLVHRGHVTAAGWLFALIEIAAIAASIPLNGNLIPIFFLTIPVIMAALVLPTAHSWWVMLVGFAGMAIGILSMPGLLLDMERMDTLSAGALLLLTTTFLSYLGGQAMEQSLYAAEMNARDTAAAQARLEVQARDLEVQAEALRHTEQQLHDLIATLETPTVALAEGVLLAPLIGAIDSRRAQTLTERLLNDIARQRVQLLILDIAGVTLIDTSVAQTLIRIMQAVRLLGCRVVLTGVAATVALTLTHLGTDLDGMETARSPQEVLGSLAASAGAPAVPERPRQK